jgi:hypothetical protein
VFSGISYAPCLVCMHIRAASHGFTEAVRCISESCERRHNQNRDTQTSTAHEDSQWRARSMDPSLWLILSFLQWLMRSLHKLWVHCVLMPLCRGIISSYGVYQAYYQLDFAFRKESIRHILDWPSPGTLAPHCWCIDWPSIRLGSLSSIDIVGCFL